MMSRYETARVFYLDARKVLRATSTRATNPDIHFLARQWDDLVGRWEYCSQREAVDLLFPLVDIFRRGQGIRVHNIAAHRNDDRGDVALMTCVLGYVAQNDSYMFENVREKLALYDYTGVEALMKVMRSWKEEQSADQSGE